MATIIYIILLVLALLGAIVFAAKERNREIAAMPDDEVVQDHMAEGDWGKHTIYLFPHEEENFAKLPRKAKKLTMKEQQRRIASGELWVIENDKAERALVPCNELIASGHIKRRSQKKQVISVPNAEMIPMLQHEL